MLGPINVRTQSIKNPFILNSQDSGQLTPRQQQYIQDQKAAKTEDMVGLTESSISRYQGLIRTIIERYRIGEASDQQLLQPYLAQLFFELGEIYEEQNKAELAKQQYKRAIKLGHVEAKEKLDNPFHANKGEIRQLTPRRQGYIQEWNAAQNEKMLGTKEVLIEKYRLLHKKLLGRYGTETLENQQGLKNYLGVLSYDLGKEYEGIHNLEETKKYYDLASGMGHFLAQEKVLELVKNGEVAEIERLRVKLAEKEEQLRRVNEMKSDLALPSTTTLLSVIDQQNESLRVKVEQIPTLISKAIDKAEVMIPVKGETLIAESDLRSLMGGNFFGVDEWEKYFPGQDIGPIPEIPWNNIISLLKNPNPFLEEESRTGQTIAESHVLTLQPKTISGKQLSVSKWCEIINKNQHESPKKAVKIADYFLFGSVKNKDFAKIAKDSHWILMPKEFIPKSYRKTFSEQKNLMEKNYPQYEIISAVELVGGIMQHYLNTGKRLASEDYKYMTFNNNNFCPYFRTSDKTKTLGDRVGVGGFGPDGLGIYGSDGGLASDCIGLGASLRKSS